MIRRFAATVALAFAALAFIATAAANAAPDGTYYLEGNGQDFYSSTLTVSGGAVTAARFQLTAQQCSSPAGTPSGTGAVISGTVPFSPAQIVNGSFTVTAAATSDYSATAGTVTISGQVSTTGALTGTISVADFSTPFYSGCTGSYSFIGLTNSGQLTSGTGLPGLTAASGHRDYVTYSSPQAGLSFNYANGTISALSVFDSEVRCGGSVDGVYLNAAGYGQPAIAVHNGAFSYSSWALDEYNDVLNVQVSGSFAGGRATGTITVSQPAGFSPYASGGCNASSSWTATPPPLGVSAKIGLVRLQIDRGPRYRYYLVAMNLTGTNGANAATISVGGYSVTTALGRRTIWISRPISLNAAYRVRITALERKGRRILSRLAQTPIIYMVPPNYEILWSRAGGRPSGRPPQ